MKFSDSELILLSGAAQREDRAVVPLKGAKAAALANSIARMLKQRLLDEIPASGSLPVFRRDDERGPLALVITNAGMSAIGVIEAPGSEHKPSAPQPKASKSARRKPDAPKGEAPKGEAPKGKLGILVQMLRRPKGATIEELVKATGWQAHSVRGAISGALKKKLKLNVLSEKTGSVRTYRIGGDGA